jgi:ribosomal RNA-processing protein 9
VLVFSFTWSLTYSGFHPTIAARLISFAGSWEGSIRIWKLDASKLRSFTLVGTVLAPGVVNSLQLLSVPQGALNGSAWARPADNASTNGTANGLDDGGLSSKKVRKVAQGTDSVLLVAGIGQETRLGRWLVLKDGVKNGAMVVMLHPQTSS